MTIIFDEVTGSVEPRDARDRREPERPAKRRDERSAPADEAAIDRRQRRRAWLEARRRAD
jgi:hypothetical protein